MSIRTFCLLPLAAVLAHADVTLRQVMEFQLKMPIPAGQTIPGPFNGPMEVVSHIKGDRAHTTFGAITAITDATKVTLIDAQGKRFATLPVADYLPLVQKDANLSNMPEQARQMLAGIKVEVQSNLTGRTERIQGIDAAEHEISFQLTIPIPLPGQANGLQVTGKFQCWKPKAGEAERVKALKEMEAYYAHTSTLGNSTDLLKGLFGAIPGMGESLRKLTDEMNQGGRTLLRLRGAFYMPGLAAIVAQAHASGASVPDLPPPDSPLVEMRIDLSDLNTEPVAESLFAIPAGYQEAPMEDLVKALVPALAAKQ